MMKLEEEADANVDLSSPSPRKGNNSSFHAISKEDVSVNLGDSSRRALISEGGFESPSPLTLRKRQDSAFDLKSNLNYAGPEATRGTTGPLAVVPVRQS